MHVKYVIFSYFDHLNITAESKTEGHHREERNSLHTLWGHTFSFLFAN